MGEVVPILRIVPAAAPDHEQLLLRPVAAIIHAGAGISCPFRVRLLCRRPPVRHEHRTIASLELLTWVRAPAALGYSPRKLRQGARPKSLGAARPLSEIERRQLRRDEAEFRKLGILPRPRVLSDCIDEPGPCPWAGCRHHTYLDVNPETGAIKLNFPALEVDQMPETCSLRVARAGALSLEEVGKLVNLTQERVSQIEDSGREKLRDGIGGRED